ncbi:hypothetical protein V6N13_051118 [Hibiscus sabdariffa]|uniref:Uncharacterized protein n=1 Tax=Hibiscus sabdariffa TaxID=183260 RepID=A0ABR2T2V4_9ROSI
MESFDGGGGSMEVEWRGVRWMVAAWFIEGEVSGEGQMEVMVMIWAPNGAVRGLSSMGGGAGSKGAR